MTMEGPCAVAAACGSECHVNSISETLTDLRIDETAPELPAWIVYIDSIDDVPKAVDSIAKMLQDTNRRLGLDCEGVRLGADGQLSLLQLGGLHSNPDHKVFIFDIGVMGNQALHVAGPKSKSTLKGFLESSEIQKVGWDLRADAAALFHTQQVRLDNVFDLQLAEVALRRKQGHRVQYVAGFDHVFSQHIPPESPYHDALLTPAMERGRALYRKRLGGDSAVWGQRPLHPDLVVCAAIDGKYMLILMDILLAGLKKIASALAYRNLLTKLEKVSQQRVQESIDNAPGTEFDSKERTVAPKF